MVYAQPRIRPENKTHNLLWDFEIQKDRLISVRRLNLAMVNKKSEPVE